MDNQYIVSGLTGTGAGENDPIHDVPEFGTVALIFSIVLGIIGIGFARVRGVRK